MMTGQNYSERVPQAANIVPTQEAQIPPFGNLHIPRHKTGMYVRLLMHRSSGLHPYLLAEVKERVRDDGRDGCERQAVRYSECR